MTLTIKRKHIKEGKRLSFRCDPVALALREIFPSSRVGAGATSCLVDLTEYEYSRPLADWVAKFDNKEKVKPATFRLREVK